MKETGSIFGIDEVITDLREIKYIVHIETDKRPELHLGKCEIIQKGE